MPLNFDMSYFQDKMCSYRFWGVDVLRIVYILHHFCVHRKWWVRQLLLVNSSHKQIHRRQKPLKSTMAKHKKLLLFSVVLSVSDCFVFSTPMKWKTEYCVTEPRTMDTNLWTLKWWQIRFESNSSQCLRIPNARKRRKNQDEIKLIVIRWSLNGMRLFLKLEIRHSLDWNDDRMRSWQYIINITNCGTNTLHKYNEMQ